MRYDDDLAAIDERLRLVATAANMIVLPTPPGREPGAVVEWPYRSWEGFLRAAQSLRVRLLYMDLHRFSEEHLRAKFAEPQASEAATRAWNEARCRLGEPHVLEAAWLYRGVVHYWRVEASWHRDLDRRLRGEDVPAADPEHERRKHVTRTGSGSATGRGSHAIRSSRSLIACPRPRGQRN